MARLTSLASVLAALEPPGDGRGSRSDGVPRAGGPRAGRPGFQIWESARRQADFYVAYAEMLETDRHPRGPGDAWVQELYPSGQWVGPAALATSYRLAAQHAALVDVGWATRLAVRAGMAYVSAGLPFGLFLLTGLLDDQTLDDGDAVREAVVPFRSPDDAAALRHPAQLTYLLLAAASRPWLHDELGPALRDAAQRLAPHRGYPIGPQGVPLGDYLTLAAALGDDDQAFGHPGRRAAVTNVAGQLADLSRTQAGMLRAAQRNRYLWLRGASPVAVIDLENVALSGLALRSRPWFAELSEAITTELDTDDELAQLPVWTMDAIDSELPEIAPNITGIMREPERAWRTEDFREPETEMDPWTTDRGNRPQARRTGDDTRPDYPGTRPDYGPEALPYGYPDSAPGADGEEDGDEHPYFGDI